MTKPASLEEMLGEMENYINPTEETSRSIPTVHAVLCDKRDIQWLISAIRECRDQRNIWIGDKGAPSVVTALMVMQDDEKLVSILTGGKGE